MSEGATSFPEGESTKPTPDIRPQIDIQKKAEGMEEKMRAEEEKKLAIKLRAERQYNEVYTEFRAGQDKIMKAAEDKLPAHCSRCSSVVRSNKDKVSIKKNGSCISCFFNSEEHRTQVSKDNLASEETSRIAALDLSDYEDWLFGDEMGQRCLSRILTKLKREGFDYKPWQVSIAASAWSKDNYSDTNLSDTRHVAERVKISELSKYIPQNADSIREVIASVKRAEDIIKVENSKKGGYKWWLVGGFTVVAASIPLLWRRR